MPYSLGCSSCQQAPTCPGTAIPDPTPLPWPLILSAVALLVAVGKKI